MKKELKVSEETSIMVQEEVNMNEWGVTVESKDLVLPKLLVQQSMSEAVKQKTAEEGDIVNTLTGENVGKSIEVLPFFKTENIVIEKFNGKKFIYDRTIPYEGKMLAFEEEINGVRFKNSHQYLFYVLVNGTGMPHVLSFKGTSNKIGRQLATLLYISNPAEKLPPPGKLITFSGKQETSKSGDVYQVSSFVPSRRSTKEEIAECLKWVKVLKETNFAVADEAPVQEATSTIF